MKHLLISVFSAATILLLATSLPADANERSYHKQRASAHAALHRHQFYRHGRYIDRLPKRYHRVRVGPRDYYYYGGNFLRPHHKRYRVIRAPRGMRVPYLAPGYVSFYIGPRRYFYVNHTYYLWDRQRHDYVVVDEPEGAENAVIDAARGESSEIYAYPASGQSAEDQERDYYDCHLWAVEQADFDPTLEGQNIDNDRDYRRAMVACLQGRGYSVQ